ncbi:MAG: UbiA family prenyltransferase [Theionarchaea archaeon]|nr:UbiA family prenyltransferase [Theionarchaea archaeon]
MNKIKALIGFYRIHRVIFNLIFAVLIIIILSRGTPEFHHLVLGPLLFALGLFSVVGVNNIRDVVADRISKKGQMESFNPLATGILTEREAWMAALLPLVFGILIAIVWINTAVVLFFMLFIGASLFYDLFGKKVIMAPFISPACLALFIVLFGIMMDAVDDPVFPYLVILFYLFMVVGQIGLDMLDYEGDKAAGYARLTVVYGPVKGAHLAIILSLLMPALSFCAYFHLEFSWISLPFTGLALLLTFPVTNRYRAYGREVNPLNAKKALTTLMVQYLVIMVAFMTGLQVVG